MKSGTLAVTSFSLSGRQPIVEICLSHDPFEESTITLHSDGSSMRNEYVEKPCPGDEIESHVKFHGDSVDLLIWSPQ